MALNLLIGPPSIFVEMPPSRLPPGARDPPPPLDPLLLVKRVFTGVLKMVLKGTAGCRILHIILKYHA